ncbi:MAG: hypothetical protein KF745_07940 [Phycisphaeraceae bacterium]|nr:hypothetical protein [Phycisphaeraceae bacterium]
MNATSRATGLGGVDSIGRLESLEPRVLLAAFTWTAEEVYLTELVNRARANPMAEAARLGIDLTDGLTAAELARLVPSEPLALEPSLTIAARLHSLDMAERDFFDHVNPDGLSPTQRAQDQGYAGTAGENIAAGYDTIDEVHKAWLVSIGHRKNVLSLHSNFSSTFHYDEFGPGFAFTEISPFYDYYSQEFGVQSGAPDRYILGVVFTDADSNGFYGVGEGANDIRIDVFSAANQSLVGSYTTDYAGNYQIAVPSGTYSVVFTNLSTGKTLTRQTAVSDVNVKLDALTTQIITSPGGNPAPIDDHANAGDWSGATPVFLQPATGDGAAGGIIDPATDTDLFRFTVSATGTMTIRVLTPGSSLVGAVRLFGESFNPLGSGIPSGDGGDSVLSISVVTGQTYYVQVESGDAASTGGFTLSIDGPALPPSGGGGGTVPGLPNPYMAGTGQNIYGSATASGRLTVLTTNNAGRPVVLQRAEGGVWVADDLLQLSGGPTSASAPQTWTDPKDGLTYAAARSSQGLLLFINHANGSWDVRNLTAEIAGSTAIVSQPTVFIETVGTVHIAGLNASGHLVMYEQIAGAGIAGKWSWRYVDLTTRDLNPQGFTTPAFAGDLISYVTSWNGMNIAGLDSNGDIQVVWIAGDMTQWAVDNLSQITGAPALTGSLTSFLTPWGGINLAGADAQGKLSITWWLPEFLGAWRTNNLTDDVGGPVLKATSAASYVTPWGGLNIAGIDNDGRVVVYWWAPGMKELFGSDYWRVDVLSDTVPAGTDLPTSRLIGVSYNATINLLGAGETGEIIRYFWQIGGVWQAENVSDLVAPA